MFLNIRNAIAVTLILLVSGYFFFSNYLGLEERLAKKGLILDGIQAGKHTYAILHAGSCIGEIDISTSQEKLLGLEFRGSVDSILNGKKENLFLYSLSYFNPLGQLVGAESTLINNEQRLRSTVDGITPLKLLARGSFGLFNFSGEQNYTAEGPVILSFDEEKKSFELSYPPLTSMPGMLSLASMQIEFIADSPCPDRQALDLTLLESVLSFAL